MKNWDDLRYFRGLVGAHSIRAAAARLGTTHATVSRRIRELESDLGQSLFERDASGYVLTEFGEAVCAYAQAIEENVLAIDRLSFASGDALQGPLRLSVYAELYDAVLAPHVDAFMARHPLIELDVSLSGHALNLSKRQADVVVRLTQSPPEHLYGRRVSNSPLALYASNAYLAERPSPDLWIALDYAPSKPPQLDAKTVFRTNSLRAAGEAVSRGRGLALLPCFIEAHFPDLVRLLGHDTVPDLDVWVLTHADLRKNAKVRALMEHLYAAFQQDRRIIDPQ